jgi:hypothetical protein
MTLSRVKDTYWHSIAHVCLSAGLKPAEVSRVVKNCFPHTEINGRHIGAFKRRLINDGVIEQKVATTGSEQELNILSKELITSEDRFIYNCSVGSKVRTLKCFEYKLEQTAIVIEDDCEEWIAKIQQ